MTIYRKVSSPHLAYTREKSQGKLPMQKVVSVRGQRDIMSDFRVNRVRLLGIVA